MTTIDKICFTFMLSSLLFMVCTIGLITTSGNFFIGFMFILSAIVVLTSLATLIYVAFVMED